MIHAQCQPLAVPMLSRPVPAPPTTPIVDRATAQALRRMMTLGGVGDTMYRPRGVPALGLLCTPTIRTLPVTSEAESTPVPVVIVPEQALASVASTGRPERALDRIRMDLSWMIALFVALTVTLALAIPLELIRQNG
jgi:hypothetical protein